LPPPVADTVAVAATIMRSSAIISLYIIVQCNTTKHITLYIIVLCTTNTTGVPNAYSLPPPVAYGGGGGGDHYEAIVDDLGDGEPPVLHVRSATFDVISVLLWFPYVSCLSRLLRAM
jgi:hypothetical protein